MADNKEGTTPLVHHKESSSTARNGFLLISVAQLMAVAMCAFVMGAMIPIAVRFNEKRNADIELDAPIFIENPLNTHQLFNNLRHRNKTDANRGPKIAWRKFFTPECKACFED